MTPFGNQLRTRLASRPLAWPLWLALLWLCGLWGCAPNLIVKHQSLRARAPIHVYVDGKLLCVVAFQQRCTRRLAPGRYTFYAEVKGTRHRWGQRQRPTPFVVDRRTVIDLHDLKTSPPRQPHSKASPRRPNARSPQPANAQP